MKKFFSIRDNKAEYYHTPQLFRNKGEVLRALTNAVENPETDYGKNPEDYSLYEIGSWDEQTSKLTTNDKNHVVDLIDLKKLD